MKASATRSAVIVALDVDTAAEATRIVEQCRGQAGMFKVGKQLFMSEGPRIVREVVARGERVFLDMKFHDIPNTVAHAAIASARLGVSMMTIHASGGPEMIRATRTKLEDECGADRPILVAVTVLTSMDPATLRAVGIDAEPSGQVLKLARMAMDSGADGVVCSPVEIAMLRAELGPKAVIVTPGVRMPGQPADDQKRIAMPKEALDDGANWIVVGRYVNRAQDPGEALGKVITSLITQ